MFFEEVLCRSHSCAEMSGRTEPNLNDLRMVFEDLAITPDSLFNYIKRLPSKDITGRLEPDPNKLREIRALRARQVEANLRRILVAREKLVGGSDLINIDLQKQLIRRKEQKAEQKAGPE
ncbi:hypothetical protein HDU76_012443 [Blyttiomyces sp. JEL0837]|nr:hypothetical protein HDU76_012443 [Blyttiomyces sp. JEL0837]